MADTISSTSSITTTSTTISETNDSTNEEEDTKRPEIARPSTPSPLNRLLQTRSLSLQPENLLHPQQHNHIDHNHQHNNRQQARSRSDQLTTLNLPNISVIREDEEIYNDLKPYDEKDFRRRSSCMQRAKGLQSVNLGDLSRRLSRNCVELTQTAVLGKSLTPEPDQCSLVADFEKKINKQNDDKDVDGGYALVILFVMFVINASTFGTARAYGLIFEKSARDDATGRVEAALPFTIMGALENMSGPLAGYILTKFQSWRLTIVLGSALVTLAHLSAALFDSLPGRIVTMGIVCGFGTSLITISSFQINNAYFDKYRSRAFGFGLTGAAFGTLYISPLCRYVLDEYSINSCYIVLGLMLLPNVALALLLKPKPLMDPAAIVGKARRPSIYSLSESPITPADMRRKSSLLPTIAGDLQKRCQIKSYNVKLRYSIKRVLFNPIFHLIWPTQLIFCWLNFVIGMVVVDYAKDRGLNETELTYLIPVWALGQLIGRLVLGAVVDMKLISYRSFTVVCLSSIATTLWLLGNIHHIFRHEGTTVMILILILSIFIANLYILFNGLVAHYIESELTAMSIGISSFISSFFLLPRAHVIGHYRDTLHSYDGMIDLFTYVTAASALIWLLLPTLARSVNSVWLEPRKRSSRLQKIIDSNPWLIIPNSKLHGQENPSSTGTKDEQLGTNSRISITYNEPNSETPVILV